MIRIGTRGSALALAQARWVAGRVPSETRLLTITTAGDRGVPISDKSRWVTELERALLADEIDLAVHSAKDVPVELPDGLELVAFTERADARDGICGASSLDALEPGSRVGTSSIRRAAQINAIRDDLCLVPVRGNVDTRLRKLSEGDLDALVLALAGLERLGRAADGILEALVPAAGQGALALEARPGRLTSELLAPLRDPVATTAVSAERRLVEALAADCSTPVGAHARMVDHGALEMTGWVGLPDGSAWVRDRLRGTPDEVGTEVAARLLAAGAEELLRASRQSQEQVR